MNKIWYRATFVFDRRREELSVSLRREKESNLNKIRLIHGVGGVLSKTEYAPILGEIYRIGCVGSEQDDSKWTRTLLPINGNTAGTQRAKKET